MARPKYHHDDLPTSTSSEEFEEVSSLEERQTNYVVCPHCNFMFHATHVGNIQCPQCTEEFQINEYGEIISIYEYEEADTMIQETGKDEFEYEEIGELELSQELLEDFEYEEENDDDDGEEEFLDEEWEEEAEDLESWELEPDEYEVENDEEELEFEDDPDYESLLDEKNSP